MESRSREVEVGPKIRHQSFKYGIFFGRPVEEKLKEAHHSPKLHSEASTRPLRWQIVIGRAIWTHGTCALAIKDFILNLSLNYNNSYQCLSTSF